MRFLLHNCIYHNISTVLPSGAASLSAWQRLLTKKLPLIHNQYVDMGNPTQMENIYVDSFSLIRVLKWLAHKKKQSGVIPNR